MMFICPVFAEGIFRALSAQDWSVSFGNVGERVLASASVASDVDTYASTVYDGGVSFGEMFASVSFFLTFFDVALSAEDAASFIGFEWDLAFFSADAADDGVQYSGAVSCDVWVVHAIGAQDDASFEGFEGHGIFFSAV